MRQISTKSIVLGRTDYGEADRIITLLTPDHGKLHLMARGVRRVKSKLAGGIELFSISDITYMPGKGDIGTLISSRLETHYGKIVQDIDRVQLGYELIRQLNKATEDEPEEDYFELLSTIFKELNNPAIDLELIKIWFQAQLLRLSGHSPNLQTDSEGRKLAAERSYDFDFESMAFIDTPAGHFAAGHIKVLRLLFSTYPPDTLSHIQGVNNVLEPCAVIIRTVAQNY